MSGRLHRMMRKQASEVAAHHAKILAPAIQGVGKNEEMTRARVQALENHAGDVDAMFQRPLLGRLKWLLTGR